MTSFSQICPGKFVIDASVLVGLVQGLPEARRFTPVLMRATTSAVTLGETFYISFRRSPRATPALVESALLALGVAIESVTISVARHFNELKRIDALRVVEQQDGGVPHTDCKKLSLGDMVCLGQAISLGLPVLTGDRHWETLIPHGLSIPVMNFRDPALVV